MRSWLFRLRLRIRYSKLNNWLRRKTGRTWTWEPVPGVSVGSCLGEPKTVTIGGKDFTHVRVKVEFFRISSEGPDVKGPYAGSGVGDLWRPIQGRAV